MSTPGSERRKAVRAEAKLEVKLSGVSAGTAGGEVLSVPSLNIGAGGVYVQVPHHIEPLTKLELTLMIPGPTPGDEPVFVETEAIVVRTQPEAPAADVEFYEVACAFLDLADEYRDAIHRYILTHRTAGAAPA